MLMSSTGSIATYNFTHKHSIRSSHRFQTINFNPSPFSVISTQKDKCSFLRYQTMRRCFNVKDTVVFSSVQPGPPLPSNPIPDSWKLRILVMIITLILPSWRSKWGPFQRFKMEAEQIVEAAEHVAEIVEKVAEEVEDVAEDVLDHLPQDGKLKDAVTFVENVAKEIAKDAHLAMDIMEKIEEVDAFIDPVIVQPNETTKESNDNTNSKF